MSGSTEARPERRAVLPWPAPPGGSAVAALVATWKESALEPGRFFRKVPQDEAPGPAVLYYLVIGVTAAGVDLFWRSVLQLLWPPDGQFLALLGPATGGWAVLVDFLLSPLYLTVGLLLATGVVHLVLLLVGGARRGIRTTLRTLCFAYGPRLLVVVPVVGGFVGSIWMIVLAIVGLREAHGTDGWRAALAVLLPVAGMIVLSVVAAVLASLLGVSLPV